MSEFIHRDARNSSKRRLLGLLGASALVATLGTLLSTSIGTASAQTPPSLWGSLLIYQGTMRPLPAAGYVVYLYSNRIGWSRPSYTDGYGRYAHYGVPPGKYLLHIRNYQNQVVWQQDVMLGNGSTQVPQIVLPRP